jgi:ribosomal protein S18 acetylase RimI-like enzyme
MTSLDIAFGNSEANNDNFSSSFSYIEIDEDSLLHRKHVEKQKIYENDDIEIKVYPYDQQHLDYITNYIYPFWKLEFLNKFIEKQKQKVETPLLPRHLTDMYSNWTNEELSRFNMGLKDNTLCFELNMSDVTIGFCGIVLIDQYDRESKFGPFGDAVYEDSALLYNFVIEKAFRGKGYGKQMIQQVTDYVRNLDKYKAVVLYVDRDNDVAKKLYESVGFHFVYSNRLDETQDVCKYIF